MIGENTPCVSKEWFWIAEVGRLESAFVFTGFALQLFHMALDCRRCLTLTYGSRLFVKLTPPHFRQYAGLFTRPLKPPQSDIKWFVLSYFNVRHWAP